MGEEFKWLIDLTKSLGASAGPIFAVLWWLERQERKELHKDYIALLPQTIKAIGETKTSVDILVDIVRDMRGSLTNLGQTMLSAARVHDRGQ